MCLGLPTDYEICVSGIVRNCEFAPPTLVLGGVGAWYFLQSLVLLAKSVCLVFATLEFGTRLDTAGRSSYGDTLADC